MTKDPCKFLYNQCTPKSEIMPELVCNNHYHVCDHYRELDAPNQPNEHPFGEWTGPPKPFQKKQDWTPPSFGNLLGRLKNSENPED